MTISLRLDDKTNRRLTAAAKAKGMSKSEFVRMCVTEYLNNGSRKPTAWELGKDLFGCFRSGRGDLSVRASEIFGKMMDAKHGRRGRRR